MFLKKVFKHTDLKSRHVFSRVAVHPLAVYGGRRRVRTHAAHLRIRVLRGARQSRRRHALLFLPAVAEPDPDDLLLQLQSVRQRGDLLRGWFGTLEEVAFQRAFYAHLDGRALFPLPALGGYLIDVGRAPDGGVGLL